MTLLLIFHWRCLVTFSCKNVRLDKGFIFVLEKCKSITFQIQKISSTVPDVQFVIYLKITRLVCCYLTDF